MVPDETKACVGMEYFCFQGDDLWEMDDDGARRARHAQELAQLGLVDPAKVEKGYVTRVPLAYPMYDPDYGERVDAIRGWLETGSTTCSRSAATGCTATTTPTTRC